MSKIHINLTMLRALIAIVEERGFSRGADRIGVSQSAVSHAIRGLELAVGSPLIERQRGNVELTTIGVKVIEEARNVLQAIERLRKLGHDKNVCGTVRAGIVASISSRIAPAALRDLRRNFPDIRLDIWEGTDQEVHEWVKNDLIDFGIGGVSDHLHAEHFMEDKLRLLLPEEHVLIAQEAISLADLQGARFVMPAIGCGPHADAILKSSGIDIDVIVRVREKETLFSMVRSGVGVAILPELVLPTAVGGCASRPLTPSLSRMLYLLRGDADIKPSAAEVAEAFRRACSSFAFYSPEETILGPDAISETAA
ncbi:LysR family transcriptional regulator [Phyllobacterium sp. 628]|uniref:LysR family transcriptional regulator n=1 Tax=Phyllobacterium sp. 628 TaxID=2718938 RepID=UPI0016626C6E|nr:LysR family transcriptional regulator [Phyllobacterium sp. 628]QND53309.1 LysR family transcriptional regulator [Phyllobacterium sp. 628]